MDLDDIIADQKRRLASLGQYIDKRASELELAEFLAVLSLHGQLASRISRLERDLQKLGGEEKDRFTQVIGEALDRISKEWGIEL